MPSSLQKNVLQIFNRVGELDSRGKEHEAEKWYREVLKAGVRHLPKEEQPNFYLQFGSTLKESSLGLKILMADAIENPDKSIQRFSRALKYYSKQLK